MFDEKGNLKKQPKKPAEETVKTGNIDNEDFYIE